MIVAFILGVLVGMFGMWYGIRREKIADPKPKK